MINRSEASGLTLAVVGHVVLFGLLSVGFLATPNPMTLKPTPIEVALVDDVALESAAPVVSSEAPKTQMAAIEGPVEPEPAPPEPAVEPQPQPIKAQPSPPKPVPDRAAVPAKPSRPAPAQPPARPQPRQPVEATGRLGADFEKGLTEQPSKGKAATPPAATAGPAVKASLSAELTRKLRPFWRAPTGADVDKLRTVIRVALDRSGQISAVGECQQTGITPSNRAQAALHCENAKRAVRQAAPYNTFPPAYYEVWKVIFPAFDWRLSQ